MLTPALELLLILQDRDARRLALEAQLKSAEKPGAAGKPKLLRTQVGTEEIAEVVSRATGIPVAKMMQGEREKLLRMEEKLHEIGRAHV